MGGEGVGSFVGNMGNVDFLAPGDTWGVVACGGEVSLLLGGPRGGVSRGNAGVGGPWVHLLYE